MNAPLGDILNYMFKMIAYFPLKLRAANYCLPPRGSSLNPCHVPSTGLGARDTVMAQRHITPASSELVA